MESITPSHGPTPVADDPCTSPPTSLPTSDPLDTPITITFLRSRTVAVGQRHPTTYRRMFDGFANHPIQGVTDKLALPGFSLAVFDANHRRADRVQWVHGVALDIDNKKLPLVTLEQVLDAFVGIAVFLYTSFSHQPECPRFRAILPTNRAMRAAEFTTVWAQVDRQLRNKGVEIDQACRDASRLWFWPARSNDHFTTRLQVGELLDVDAILAEVPKPVVRDVTMDDQREDGGRTRRGRTTHPSHLIALTKECEFVKRLATEPAAISYPEWFAAATILKAFDHGESLFHGLSSLDTSRYSREATQKLLDSIKGKPTHCDKLGWTCPRRGECSSLGVQSPAGLPFKLGRRP